MGQSTETYYIFLGFHSFLLGLLPFFLPVYLYRGGAGLQQICWFIGLTGLSFSASLYCFDCFRSRHIQPALLLSFVAEVLLLLLLVVDAPWPLLALANGFYSCLYWTLQRILFLAGGSKDDSGRRFGNFQICVLVLLKTGIFAGGLLLQYQGVGAVCLISLVVVALALWLLMRVSKGLSLPEQLLQLPPTGIPGIVGFSDRFGSRLVFLLDGLFLYFESYFWVITLFIFVEQSFVRLGGIVILLALVLAVLFFLTKNRIDRVNRQKVYLTAVLLYGLSWILRGLFSQLSVATSISIEFSLMLIISFATAFFRLAFNKRFFDVAKKSTGYHYLFVKSYFSQTSLGLCFIFLGLLLTNSDGTTAEVLSWCYFGAALLSPVYFMYRNERLP
jgi:hypothetical protein